MNIQEIKEVSTWDSMETTVKDIGYNRVTMLEPHNNPEWQIRTWAQEEDLERAKSEHEDFIDLSNKGSLMLF